MSLACPGLHAPKVRTHLSTAIGREVSTWHCVQCGLVVPPRVRTGRHHLIGERFSGSSPAKNCLNWVFKEVPNSCLVTLPQRLIFRGCSPLSSAPFRAPHISEEQYTGFSNIWGRGQFSRFFEPLLKIFFFKKCYIYVVTTSTTEKVCKKKGVLVPIY